jgi:hypothetical protein
MNWQGPFQRFSMLGFPTGEPARRARLQPVS